MFKSRLLLSLLLAVGATVAAADGVKYVFLLIGDGFGENHAVLTENVAGRKLAMRRMPVHARMGTENVSSGVTDSAASGTAIACGIKTYNGAIGVDNDKQPVESIAMKLQKQGFRIGLISSSPLTDATPAAFYAHQETRAMRKEIGRDLAASGIPFVGGAGVHEKSTLDDLRQAGWDVIEGSNALARVKSAGQTFVNRSPYTPWPGTTPESPTLAEYLAKAIERLDQPGGFFIMLENGRIDYAGHANEAGMIWREVLAFEEAVEVALAFQARRPSETLVIVTADHETGGLKLESPDPEKAQLLRKQQSPLSDLRWAMEVLAVKLEGLEPDAVRRQRTSALVEALEKQLGLVFAADERPAVEQAIVQALDAGNPTEGLRKAVKLAAARRDARTGIRFTTGGHTSSKVVTHAQGPGAERFVEPLENCDLPRRIQAVVLPDQP